MGLLKSFFTQSSDGESVRDFLTGKTTQGEYWLKAREMFKGANVYGVKDSPDEYERGCYLRTRAMNWNSFNALGIDPNVTESVFNDVYDELFG